MPKSKFENELCYYAWNMNFNTDSFEKINVLRHSYIQKWLREYLSKEYNKFEDFVKELDTILRCYYSGDINYEFMAKNLSDNAKEYKVNVYDQLKLNIPIMAKYIIEVWNKHKRENNKIVLRDKGDLLEELKKYLYDYGNSIETISGTYDKGVLDTIYDINEQIKDLEEIHSEEFKPIDKVPLIDIGSHYDDEEDLETVTIDDLEIEVENERVIRELAYHIREIEERFNKLLEDMYGN